MAGRKPKITPGGPREQALLDALKLGMTRAAAAGTCDISYETFRKMMVADERFLAAVESAELWAEGRYTGIIAKAAETNWQAAAWWLERRHYETYARHDKIEMRLDVKAEAARVALELGLDEATVLAEAEAILSR